MIFKCTMIFVSIRARRREISCHRLPNMLTRNYQVVEEDESIDEGWVARNKNPPHRLLKSFQSCCLISWSFSSTSPQSPMTSRFQSSNTPAEPCPYHPCYSYTMPTHHQTLAIHPVLHRSELPAHLEGLEQRCIGHWLCS